MKGKERKYDDRDIERSEKVGEDKKKRERKEEKEETKEKHYKTFLYDKD